MNVTFEHKPVSNLTILLNKRLRRYYIEKILANNKDLVKKFTEELEDNICPDVGEYVPITSILDGTFSYNKLSQKVNDYAIKNGFWKKGFLNILLVHLIKKELRKLAFFRWC